MSASSSDELLEQTARGYLASGAGASDTFVCLVGAGVAPAEAAVAVCVAAGSPRADAERRLEEFDGLWDLMEVGEEADAADVLARHGYFEPDATLSNDQQEIVALLHTVLTTVKGVPSGYAVTLFKDLRTGRLVKAFLQLEWLGGIRWKENREFWIAMCRAGEAFADDDAALDSARQRCLERVVDL
ncbi:hypothetical protein [Hamadaea tsunoensis]|uniref:hypothetical protein n=1 Tax=Hamadaea tsunoensis TaxID=53368 RepID=UPI000485ACE2|nr:hypothetical protein [Hamadaea tsunoensis]